MIPQLRHGGAERVVSNLSFLLNKDYNIKIIVFDSTNITYDIGCEVISLNQPPELSNNLFRKVKNSVKRILKYNKFKKDNNIDITYSFGDTANIINVLSTGNDKKIISIRGYKRIRTGKTILDKILYRPMSIMICKLSDRIISVSEEISEKISSEYKINKDKIHTIYNGYNVEKIRTQMQEKLTSSENILFLDEVIITAGTFRYEKGYWHLLKAFSLVLKEYPDVKLGILGTDHQNYKEKVVELVKKMGIDGSVIFLGYKKNPYKYFDKSQLYVLSSVFEGFPNTLVEAMACGLPVVAMDCKSGPKEILSGTFKKSNKVETKEYGILSPLSNVKENFSENVIEEDDKMLAEAIILGLNKETKNFYSKKSLIRANTFNYENWVKAHKKAFNFE